MGTVFGPIVTGADVRVAVRETVRLWSRDYLSEIARHSGRATGDLPSFRTYASALDMEKFAEDQLPACIIVAPGLLDAPERKSKQYRAQWGVGVGVVVSGQDRDNTFELCELYTAAVRALIVQHPSLGDFAEGVSWVGERYDELGTDDLRTIAAGTVQLSVDVANVVDPTTGLTAPQDPTGDPGDWGVVQEVVIDTQQRS